VAVYDPVITAPSSEDGYWAAQGLVAGTAYQSVSDPTLTGAAIATVHFSRLVPAALREDLCAISVAIAKGTGSNRSTPAVTDLPTLEPFLLSWIQGMNTKQSSGFSSTDITWHFRNAAALRDGPAVRVLTTVNPGAVASSRLPDQDSATVTLATASRRHWGRVYYPGIANSQVDSTYGRWINAFCDFSATAMDGLINSAHTAGFTVGVWSKVGKAFLDPYGVHVDNIVDIQRRRRAKQRSYIKTLGH